MKRKKIPLDEYTALPPFEWRGQPHDGLLIYDLAEGNGKAPVKGATVVVRAWALTSLSARREIRIRPSCGPGHHQWTTETPTL
jgi:hypothetical protein